MKKLLIVLTILLLLPAIALASVWSKVGTSNIAISSIAVSPNFANDKTVLASSQGPTVMKYLLQSLDNWSESSSTSNSSGYPNRKLVISPNFANDKTVFVATSAGVSRSKDSGQSWAAVNNGLTVTDVKSLAISPNFANDKTLFAGTANGIFKSTNAADATTSVYWSWAGSEAPQDTINALAITPNFSTSKTIFAATNQGVYKSTNGGASWQKMSSGISTNFINTVEVSPNYANDQTVLVGTDGDGIFKSTDGGNSWQAVNTGLTGNKKVHALAFSPAFSSDKLIAASSGLVQKTNNLGQTYYVDGVALSFNGGESWQDVSFDLVEQTYSKISDIKIINKPFSILIGTDGAIGMRNINSLIINSDSNYTNDSSVTLTMIVSNVTTVQLSDDYSNWTSTAYSTTKKWTLSAGDGVKTVYAKFLDSSGKLTKEASDTIILDTVKPTTNLSVTPPQPDGNNGWYKTVPKITFIPNETATTYFKWGYVSSYSQGTYTYAPQGINKLWYYSKDLATNEEYKKSRDFWVDSLAPTPTLTTYTYSTGISTTTNFKVSWSGTDNLSGIASYDVRYKIGTNGTWTSWLTGTTLTSATFTGYPGKTYYFQVRAKDQAGNVSAWSTEKYTVVPYNQGAAKYYGTWYTASNNSLYKGDAKYTGVKGSYATYYFKNARTLSLIVTKRPKGGYGYVYINGTKVKTIDFYSSTVKYRVPIFIKSFTSPTSGTLKLYVPHAKNSSSGGYRVELDGIAVRR